MRRTFRGGAVAGLLANGSATLAAVALHLYLARVLSVEQFGIFVTVTTWATLLGTAAVFGLDGVATRFVASYQATGNAAGLASLRRFLVRMVGVASVLAVGIAAAVLILLRAGGMIDGTLALIAGVAIAGVLAAALALAWQGALRGARRVAAAVVPVGVLRPVLVIALVHAALMAQESTGALHAVVSWVIATVAAAVAAGVLWRRTAGPLGASSPRGGDPAAWGRAGVGLAVIALGTAINSHADVLMLGALKGAEAAGLYAPAARLAHLASFGLLAVNAIGAPMLAAAHARGDGAGLQAVLRLITWAGAVLAAPVLGVLALAPEAILGLFGPAFVAAAPVLVVLLAGQVVNVAAGPGALLMTMTGHHRHASAYLLAGVATNLALNALLIPPFGEMGAAVATAAGLMVWNGLITVHALRRMGVNPTLVQPLPARWARTD